MKVVKLLLVWSSLQSGRYLIAYVTKNTDATVECIIKK